jgi:hypothetical protein
VLSQTDPAAAEGLWDRYLAALRAEDFRQGENFHAPWENIGLNSASFQNPVFLPSVTLPFSVLSDPKRHQNPYMNH